jgi:hypothetical protein
MTLQSQQPFTEKDIEAYIKRVKADTRDDVRSVILAMTRLTPIYQNSLWTMLLDGTLDISDLLDLSAVNNSTVAGLLSHANALSDNTLNRRRRIRDLFKDASTTNELNDLRTYPDSTTVIPAYRGDAPIKRSKNVYRRDLYNELVSLDTTGTPVSTVFTHRIQPFNNSAEFGYRSPEEFARVYRQSILKKFVCSGIPEYDYANITNFTLQRLGLDGETPTDDEISNFVHTLRQCLGRREAFLTIGKLMVDIDSVVDTGVKIFNPDVDPREIEIEVKYKSWRKNRDRTFIRVYFGDGSQITIQPSNNTTPAVVTMSPDGLYKVNIVHTYTRIQPFTLRVVLFNERTELYSRQFTIRLSGSNTVDETFTLGSEVQSLVKIRSSLYRHFIAELDRYYGDGPTRYTLTPSIDGNRLLFVVGNMLIDSYENNRLVFDGYVVYKSTAAGDCIERFKISRSGETSITLRNTRDVTQPVRVYIRVYALNSIIDRRNFVFTDASQTLPAVNYNRRQPLEVETLLATNIVQKSAYADLTTTQLNAILDAHAAYTDQYVGSYYYRQFTPMLFRMLIACMNLETSFDMQNISQLDLGTPDIDVVQELIDAAENIIDNDLPPESLIASADDLKSIIFRFLAGLLNRGDYVVLVYARELLYTWCKSHAATISDLLDNGIDAGVDDTHAVHPYQLQSVLNHYLPAILFDPPVVPPPEFTAVSNKKYREFAMYLNSDDRDGAVSMNTLSMALLSLNLLGWIDDGVALAQKIYVDCVSQLGIVPYGIYTADFKDWVDVYDSPVSSWVASNAYFKYNTDVATMMRNEITLLSNGYSPDQITQTLLNMYNQTSWVFSERQLSFAVSALSNSLDSISFELNTYVPEIAMPFTIRHADAVVTLRSRGVRKNFIGNTVTFNISDFDGDPATDFSVVDVTINIIDSYGRAYRLRRRGLSVSSSQLNEPVEILYIEGYSREFMDYAASWNRLFTSALLPSWNRNLINHNSNGNNGPYIPEFTSAVRNVVYRGKCADSRMSCVLYRLHVLHRELQNTIQNTFPGAV